MCKYSESVFESSQSLIRKIKVLSSEHDNLKVHNLCLETNKKCYDKVTHTNSDNIKVTHCKSKILCVMTFQYEF